MAQLPKFRIVTTGHRYHLYLGHGHRLTKNFGKIAENCTTALGLRYTLLRFPMRNLIKLHFSKGLNFFNSFSHNFYFEKCIEPRWLPFFQRIFSFPKKMNYCETLANKFVNSQFSTYPNSRNVTFPALNINKFPMVPIYCQSQRGLGHPYGASYYTSKLGSQFIRKEMRLKKRMKVLSSWSYWIQLKMSSFDRSF